MHTNACVMCVYTQFPHGGKLFGVKMNVSQQEGSVGFHKVQNGHNDVWESKLCETQAKIFRHTLLRLWFLATVSPYLVTNMEIIIYVLGMQVHDTNSKPQKQTQEHISIT